MQRGRVILCCVALLFQSPARAVQTTVQMGANQGLLAAGFRWEWDFFQTSLTYGLTPSQYGAAITTQSNLKLNFKLHEDFLWRYYLGGGLLVNQSQFTQFTLPSQYPKGYYPPDAYYFTIQQTLYLGNYFIELSIIDYYLEVLFRNRLGDVRTFETISLGIGVDF